MTEAEKVFNKGQNTQMASDILKTAVIGLGRIAWSDHLPALLRHPGKFQVTAVVDPIEDRRRDTCAEFHVPAGYASLEELLAHQAPDLVIVASPTVYHAQNTIEALEHGCHVFCDKPVAMTLQEACQMDETARRKGRKLMIFQPRRLNFDTVAVRSLLKSGILGKIYQLKLYVGNYSRRNDWQAFQKNGGGMLRNYGAHYVDQFICLLHEKLRLLTCTTDRIASLGDADDVVKMLLRSESGILLDLDINQASALQPYRWCIYGKYGTAMVRGTANDWEIRRYDPAELKPVSADERMAAQGREYPSSDIPFRTETFRPEAPAFCPIDGHLLNFYDCIRENAEPLVPFSETLEQMRIIEECIRLQR